MIKQPLIIGHIITGILVGPAALNFVHSGETLEIFASIGIALLLFLVGLGLNPKVIKEVGKVALFTGVGQVVFTTLVGYLLLLLMGLSTPHAIYLAIALAFSSTIIVLKILADKKELSRLHGKIAMGFLLVQDVIATISLLFVTANSSGGMDTIDLLTLLSKALILIGSLLIMTFGILPHMGKIIAGNQEFLFLFSIAWGLGVGAAFKALGFSLEIGALAAGITLSSFSYAQEAASRLKPLRDFFIILFFIALGSRLELNSVIEVLPQAILLSIFVLIGNPIIVMIIMGLLGYTKKISFKAGLAVAQISEFSLVLLLLANKLGKIDDRILSLATMIGLITIAVSTYMMLYDEKLYTWVERYLSLFERRRAHRARENNQKNELMLFGYHKGGREFIKLFGQMHKKYVVIDYDPEVIEHLERQKINYLYGDATDIELLQEAGLEEAKLVVSTITDGPTNMTLVKILNSTSRKPVFICHADSALEAEMLYDAGASYVMMPHYIGSEKISSFIKSSKLNKSEFKKFRQKHLEYLQKHHG